MSASSYRPISLSVAGSSETQYLVPNSLRLYNTLDSRATMSFQLRMPSTDISLKPSIGQQVYLAAGTSQVYTTMAGIRNQTFGGELASTNVGYGWIGGMSTRYWLKRIDGLKGAVSLTSNSLKFVNSATSTDQVLGAYQNLYGNYSSNAIPIEPYTDYRISVGVNLNIATLNGGNIQMAVYTGAASTMAVLKNITDSTSWTGAASLTTTFTNTTNRYMDIKLGVNGEEGTVIFDNLLLEKITPPYIFGGSIENYKLSNFPNTNYYQIDYNAVDFSQMLDKRIVYKSYQSSGLGDFTFVNTSETFTGDGLTRAWALSYPAASSVCPVVTLNGLACDTTAFGEASTAGYYYTPSSNFILGNTSNNAPATTDSLKVVYQAQVGATMFDSDIIEDINRNFLNGEIIDGETCVSPVSEVGEINYNYTPCGHALNALANVSGKSWYVDPWKRIHYPSSYNVTTPFSLTTATNNWRNMVITKNRGQYRNREYLLGSYGAVSKTESFAGDGQTKSWTVSQAIQATPMVKVDGYPATVGIAGVSATTFGYYWNKESNQVSCNTSNSAPASTDWITIEYQALTPIVAKFDDASQQSWYSNIEGNSGIYESVDAPQTKCYTEHNSLDMSQDFVEKYGTMLETVTFETDNDGLVPGMLIHITTPLLDDDYLITQISASDVERRTMRYKVTAVSGSNPGGWIDYFKSIITEKKVRYGEPYENLKVVTRSSYA